MEWNFGEVLWTMLVFFLWILYIWMFIAIFGDIFRRRDLSGWGKAGWVLFIFVLPLLGILIYMVTRPKLTEEDLAAMGGGYGHRGYAAQSTADEIAKLAELREKGTISDAEYERLKSRAIG